MKCSLQQDRLTGHAINNLLVLSFQNVAVGGIALDHFAFERNGPLNGEGKGIARLETAIVQPVHVLAGGGIVFRPAIERLAVLVSGRQYERAADGELVADIGDTMANQW